MDALEERCRANGLDPQRLSEQELKEREPNITGLGALFVRVTGIVDYPAMARAMAKELEEAGGEVVLSCAVTGIAEGPDNVSVATSKGLYERASLWCAAGFRPTGWRRWRDWM
jgi:L-2-hydroxyglutarate oxidase